MASAILGYMSVVIAVVFFGSNFIIVKKYDSGDGVFFQLMLCLGIWTAGLVCNFAQGSPTVWPFAMVGGALWACGNVLCVYIIKRIGLGMGLVVWGSTTMLVGWLTGFVGLFGLPKDELTYVWLNVVGVCFAVASLGISFLVTPNKAEESDEYEYHSHLEQSIDNPTVQDMDEKEFEGDAEMGGSKVLPLFAAVVAGCFFGNNFDPPTYISTHNCDDKSVGCIEKYRGASADPLDYVFSHFCGILLMSMVIFFVYCAYTKNKPWVSPEICLPAYLSGIMWAIAQIGWFIANGALGYATAFPLITIGPGFVGMMWSVFWFKEITGTKNFVLVAAVFACAIACSVCTVLSR